jgi:chromobox protein 1
MVNASSKKRRRENSSNNEDESEHEYQVEAILDKRASGKKTEYLLKWQGYSNEDNTVRFSKKAYFFFS